MVSGFEVAQIPGYIGVVGFVLWALIERWFHLSRQRQEEAGRERDRGTYWLISLFWYAAILFSIVDAFSLQWTTVDTPLQVLRWIGAPFVLIGLVIRVLARRALGQHYSVRVKTAAEHELIKTGLYGTVRHPAYLGLLCLLIGIPLSMWSLAGLVIALTGGVPAILHRIRVEEAALSDWFGPEWETYAENTWRILPYIW